jgi:hypothetical protein
MRHSCKYSKGPGLSELAYMAANASATTESAKPASSPVCMGFRNPRIGIIERNSKSQN